MEVYVHFFHIKSHCVKSFRRLLAGGRGWWKGAEKTTVDPNVILRNKQGVDVTPREACGRWVATQGGRCEGQRDTERPGFHNRAGE